VQKIEGKRRRPRISKRLFSSKRSARCAAEERSCCATPTTFGAMQSDQMTDGVQTIATYNGGGGGDGGGNDTNQG